MAEFEKPGVATAKGYFLLTNVPATVPWVLSLRDAWDARGAGRPFTVWDAVAINGRLDHHPHIGLSRSLALHAIAMAEIVPVIWGWAGMLFHKLLNNAGGLWPVDIRIQQFDEYRYSVTTPFGPSVTAYRLRTDRSLALRDVHPVNESDIVAAEHHRIAGYVMSTLFKQAFLAWPDVVADVGRLDAAVRSVVQELAARLTDPEGPLRALPEAARARAALPVAFFALKAASARSSILLLNGQTLAAEGYQIYDGPEAVAMGPELDALLARLRDEDHLCEVWASKDALLASVQRLVDGLWHPARTGLDAPSRIDEDRS